MEATLDFYIYILVFWWVFEDGATTSVQILSLTRISDSCQKNMIFRSSITSHGDKNVGSGWRAERNENQEKLTIPGVCQSLVNQYWTNLWDCICQNLHRGRDFQHNISYYFYLHTKELCLCLYVRRLTCISGCLSLSLFLFFSFDFSSH